MVNPRDIAGECKKKKKRKKDHRFNCVVVCSFPILNWSLYVGEIFNVSDCLGNHIMSLDMAHAECVSVTGIHPSSLGHEGHLSSKV